jgi:hypothetical protein
MTLNTGAPADEAAELDLVDLGRDAGDRRAHHGVIEIALGLARAPPWPAHRAEIPRAADRDCRATGFSRSRSAAGRTQFGARGDQRVRGIVEVELRAEIALGQRRLALDVALLQVDALLHEVGHLAVDPDVGFQDC